MIDRLAENTVSAAVDGVGSAAKEFDHGIKRVVDAIGGVAAAPDHDVSSGASVEDIVAALAIENIVPRIPRIAIQ